MLSLLLVSTEILAQGGEIIGRSFAPDISANYQDSRAPKVSHLHLSDNSVVGVDYSGLISTSFPVIIDSSYREET
jgi:hypothetical protein